LQGPTPSPCHILTWQLLFDDPGILPMLRHTPLAGGRIIAEAALATMPLSRWLQRKRPQAHRPEATAEPRAHDNLQEETVHRTVDVVGTLAAVDEATVSSEADGVVSRILVDLGDHVRANDVMVELDREKSQYNFDQQKAALSRALAKYGAVAPDHLPPIEQTPDVQKAAAELVQAKQAYERADEVHKG